MSNNVVTNSLAKKQNPLFIAKWNYFYWNLKFNFLQIKTLIFIGGMLFLILLGSVFATIFWNKYPFSSYDSAETHPKLHILFVSIVPLIFFILPFTRTIFSTCFSILEEKTNRATEITISSVGTRFSFMTKVLINLIWFVSYFFILFILLSIISLICIGVFNPFFIFYWLVGLKLNHLPPNFLFTPSSFIPVLSSINHEGLFSVNNFTVYSILMVVNILANVLFFICLSVAVSSSLTSIKGGIGFLVFLLVGSNVVQVILQSTGIDIKIILKVLSFFPIFSIFSLNRAMLSCANSLGNLAFVLYIAPFFVLLISTLFIFPAYIFYSRGIFTDGLIKTVKSFIQKPNKIHPMKLDN